MRARGAAGKGAKQRGGFQPRRDCAASNTCSPANAMTTGFVRPELATRPHDLPEQLHGAWSRAERLPNGRLCYRVAQFSELTSIGRSTLWRDIARGTLTSFKRGRIRLILAEDGAAYLRGHEADPT